MTDETLTENKPPKRTNWARIGITISTIALAIVVLAFAIGYFQLFQQQMYFNDVIFDLKKQLQAANENIQVLKKSSQDMETDLQKSQAMTTQQEQLLAEWRQAQKGDLMKWQLAEAYYLVKMANDKLQLANNADVAIIFLQQAEQTLQQNQNPNLFELKKAITNDIVRLQALPKIDITSLYLKIAALDKQIDQLPLNAIPLKDQSDAKGLSSNLNEPWWRTGLRKSWHSLRQIVVVKRTDASAPPLALPDEKAFIYQNLHAQMEGVLWAVLHNNQDIYQANLDRVVNWIKTYFLQDTNLTQNLLQNLQELYSVNIKVPSENLASTLELFDSSSVQTQQPVQSEQ